MTNAVIRVGIKLIQSKEKLRTLLREETLFEPKKEEIKVAGSLLLIQISFIFQILILFPRVISQVSHCPGLYDVKRQPGTDSRMSDCGSRMSEQNSIRNVFLNLVFNRDMQEHIIYHHSDISCNIILYCYYSNRTYESPLTVSFSPDGLGEKLSKPSPISRISTQFFPMMQSSSPNQYLPPFRSNHLNQRVSLYLF